MNTAPHILFTKLPTYSDFIDGIAYVCGASMNREDSLVSKASFDKRIDVYSGRQSQKDDLISKYSLENKLLLTLVSTDTKLNNKLIAHLRCAEASFAELHSVDLLTTSPKSEVFQKLVEKVISPFLYDCITTAKPDNRSTIGSIRMLLEHREPAKLDFITTWKKLIKNRLPKNVDAVCFKSAIDKIDTRSQRKNSSIDKDIEDLRVDLTSSKLCTLRADVLSREIKNLYLAGMIIQRTIEFVKKSHLNINIFYLFSQCKEYSEKPRDTDHIDTLYLRIIDFRSSIPIKKPPLEIEEIYSASDHCYAIGRVLSLINKSRTIESCRDFEAHLDYFEGLQRLWHRDIKRAKDCFEKILAYNSSIQLGTIMLNAASCATAITILTTENIKYESLNRYIKIAIENSPLSIEYGIRHFDNTIETFRPIPDISMHDQWVIKCVKIYNELVEHINSSLICNPMKEFDARLGEFLENRNNPNFKISQDLKKKAAFKGTSIKPYDALLLSIPAAYLFSPYLSSPGLQNQDAFFCLPHSEQLRILKYIDPARFTNDFFSLAAT